MLATTSNWLFRFLATILLAAGISACGGGGGDSAAPAPAPPPPSTNLEGLYIGTMTGGTSAAFNLLVLEDGEFWMVHGNTIAGIFSVRGFIEGQGTSNNGSFSSTTARDFGTSPPTPLTISASYFAGQSVNGFLTYAGSTLTFVGGPTSNYNYNTPALLTAIAGNWNMSTALGAAVSLSINADGTFTTSSGGGCVSSGTFLPRASGKNVFNVDHTFGPAPCSSPGLRLLGVAFTYPLASGDQQLRLVEVNGSRTVGSVLFGSR